MSSVYQIPSGLKAKRASNDSGLLFSWGDKLVCVGENPYSLIGEFDMWFLFEHVKQFGEMRRLGS